MGRSYHKRTAPKETNIRAWSYSRWSAYDQCPAKAGYKFVQKLPEPGNEAMTRGSEVHKDSELYVRDNAVQRPEIPDSLFKLAKYFEEAWSYYATAEEQWCFDSNWGVTGWFDPDAWCRIKVDIYVAPNDRELKIVDVKTGKIRDDYDAQLELYALGALLQFDVDKVVCENWYTDQGEIRGGEEEGFVYTPDDTLELQTEWNSRVERMLIDTKFEPKPNFRCQWCHYRKDNGGPCKY